MAVTKKEAETAKVMTPEEEKAYYNEKVAVKLFKDNDRYKGDVFVAVNGERILIKRGEKVEIPRKFALVLEESDAQDTATANLIEETSEQYKSEARTHGV